MLNIHLPAAPSLTETHAIIHVYYLAQDKAGHSFLSPAKMNKVRLNTHSGGRVEINLTNLTRSVLFILLSQLTFHSRQNMQKKIILRVRIFEFIFFVS